MPPTAPTDQKVGGSSPSKGTRPAKTSQLRGFLFFSSTTQLAIPSSFQKVVAPERPNRLTLMKLKPLGLVAAGILMLTGCTEAATAPTTPTAVESYVGDPESTERVIGYVEAIEASYQKLYETGMTERVTSAGDRYILSYQPSEAFQAGLYNIEFDDVIVVEDELFFTVATAFRAIQDPNTVVEETDTGVSISNEQFGDFTIVIEAGLVVSGFDNGGSWEGEFSYEPDAMVTDLIADMLSEQGSE